MKKNILIAIAFCVLALFVSCDNANNDNKKLNLNNHGMPDAAIWVNDTTVRSNNGNLTENDLKRTLFEDQNEDAYCLSYNAETKCIVDILEKHYLETQNGNTSYYLYEKMYPDNSGFSPEVYRICVEKQFTEDGLPLKFMAKNGYIGNVYKITGTANAVKGDDYWKMHNLLQNSVFYFNPVAGVMESEVFIFAENEKGEVRFLSDQANGKGDTFNSDIEGWTTYRQENNPLVAYKNWTTKIPSEIGVNINSYYTPELGLHYHYDGDKDYAWDKLCEEHKSNYN